MMPASRARKIFIIAALAIVAVTATLTIIFPYGSDPSKVVWYKRVPAFAAMLGFFGCVIIVPLVKTFAKKVLQRPDEYYAPFEERLGAMQRPAVGTSLADPGAPSEEGAMPEDTEPSHEAAQPAAAGAGGSRAMKGGAHG